MSETGKLLGMLGLSTLLVVSGARAQGVGGVGAPTAADSLENNLNALRPPSPGAPTYVRVPTPQQSLDTNIDSLHGVRRNAPTPVYPPAPVPPAPGPRVISSVHAPAQTYLLPASRRKPHAVRKRPVRHGHRRPGRH